MNSPHPATLTVIVGTQFSGADELRDPMCSRLSRENSCAHYFFHITDGQTYPDNIGTELPSLVEARREALVTFSDLVKNREEWASDEWCIDIADHEGRTLLTLKIRIEEIRRQAA